jgi:hypothetical protein
LELGVVLLLAAGTLADARERGVPPTDGIVNFGKVSDNLYRGANPTPPASRPSRSSASRPSSICA